MLAFRRAAGDAFLSWEGETHIEPPREARARQGVLSLGNYWSAEGLRDPRARLVRPDALLEVARHNGDEYDRTRRVDKNYEKFRRYDTFLCWWSQQTPLADLGEPPYVIFVCQDDDQRERFLAAADAELTGHRWHHSVPPGQHEYVGRRRLLFVVEQDAHRGLLEAWRLPALPPGDPARSPKVGRVRIASTPRERIAGRTDRNGR